MLKINHYSTKRKTVKERGRNDGDDSSYDDGVGNIDDQMKKKKKKKKEEEEEEEEKEKRKKNGRSAMCLCELW